MALLDFLLFCFNMLVDGITNAGLLIHTIALFNYNMLSWLFEGMYVAFHYAAYISKALSATAVDFLANVGDFLLELLFCIKSVLIVLWKFLVLLWNVLTFVLSSIEFMAVVLWTSFVWCVKTTLQTGSNIVNGCGSTLFYGKGLLGDTFNSTVEGFSAIGKSVENLCISTWTTFVETVQLVSHSSVDFIFIKLADIRREVRYVVVDLFLNIQKEAYIGVLVCLVVYLLVMNTPRILHYMHSHGLTLPFMGGARRVADLMLHDSDEELFEDSGSDVSQEDNVSDASEESDSESTGRETNDNQSGDNSDSDSDIDIRLPDTLNDSLTRRSLRDHSRTPILFNDNKADKSREDLEREVEKEKDKRACVVCQDRSKSVLILPCRHLCLCLQCANQIVRAHFVNNRICPLCRTRIKTVMDIYV